jgi:thymidylate kinase
LGKLIAIEGISGSGKTLLSNLLKDQFDKFDFECIRLGGYEVDEHSSQITNFIHNLTKHEAFIGLPWLAETHLIISEFLLDIEINVMPSLKTNKTIIYDSYLDSIFAFQLARAFYTKNFEVYKSYLISIISELWKQFVPKPDIIIYVECDLNVSLNRIKQRDLIRLNKKQINTQNHVLRFYKELIDFKNSIIVHNNDAKITNLMLKTEKIFELILNKNGI